MVEGHERLTQDVAAYALGALDEPNRAALEAHLADCSVCRELLAEFQQVAGSLPFGLEAEAPPDAVRDNVLRHARTSSVAPSVPRAADVRVPTPTPTRGWWQLWGPRLQWAAVGILLVGLLAWNLALQGALNTGPAAVERLAGQADTQVVLLVNTPAAPEASGRLYLEGGGRQGVLAVAGLPQLPPDRVYQFWFTRPDRSTDSAGLVQVGAGGNALVPITAPDDPNAYVEVWLTQEPSGGSVRPTAPHYLEGPI
jgi:anti-sigma-K factor RskA